MEINGVKLDDDGELVLDIIKYLHFVKGAYKWPIDHPGKMYVLSTKADELLQRITGESEQDWLKHVGTWQKTQWNHLEKEFPESKAAFDHIRKYYELKEIYHND